MKSSNWPKTVWLTDSWVTAAQISSLKAPYCCREPGSSIWATQMCLHHMKEQSCPQVCPHCFVVRAFHCGLTLSSMASKERNLSSWILLHISLIYSEEERHPAYLNQFPIGTASYCSSVVQSIKFKGYVHPIYFLQEWNPHFYCFFSWEEKWPLIEEKYTCCTITAEESSPHCFEEVWTASLLLLPESWNASFYAAY